MFSDNQAMEISGDLHGNDQIKLALEFALRMEGSMRNFENGNTICVFQKAEDGGFCIGWNSSDHLVKGWEQFPFDYDADIIASIIRQHIEKTKFELGWDGDGSHAKGFLMKRMDWNMEVEGDPFYGIVVFYPYDCYYGK